MFTLRLALAITVALLPCALTGQTLPESDQQRRQEVPSPFVRALGDRLVDSQGRQILLHGLNIVSKSRATNYRIWQQEEDLAAMHHWGMNCIRLGVIWDGLEPTPGNYDEDYLDRIEQYVGWAARHGLFVVLDMHQDLFSAIYSDGAPEWATLHEDRPHVTGKVWSDAYLISPAVQTAFDNFWANTPAADGIGIQDHYAAAWRHVAERFATNDTVVGYDLMNEPFEGSSVQQAQQALLRSRFAELLIERLGGEIDSPESLLAMWLTPQGRETLTAQLADPTVHEAFANAQQAGSQRFERNSLQPMYQRVADAIRSVDPHHLLFLETSYHCNSGVFSAIEPVNNREGTRDPQQVYAPHGYDLTVDTLALGKGGTARVKLIFQRHGQTARRLQLPMVVGEWGAFGTLGEQVIPQSQTLRRLFEQLRCGDFYWDYQQGIEQQACFPAVRRSLPLHVAGTLLEYRAETKPVRFSCHWQEGPDVTSPTVVYLTQEVLSGNHIRLEPATVDGKNIEVDPLPDNSGNVYVRIPASGRAEKRSLIVD